MSYVFDKIYQRVTVIGKNVSYLSWQNKHQRVRDVGAKCLNMSSLTQQEDLVSFWRPRVVLVLFLDELSRWIFVKSFPVICLNKSSRPDQTKTQL